MFGKTGAENYEYSSVCSFTFTTSAKEVRFLSAYVYEFISLLARKNNWMDLYEYFKRGVVWSKENATATASKTFRKCSKNLIIKHLAAFFWLPSLNGFPSKFYKVLLHRLISTLTTWLVQILCSSSLSSNLLWSLPEFPGFCPLTPFCLLSTYLNSVTSSVDLT